MIGVVILATRCRHIVMKHLVALAVSLDRDGIKFGLGDNGNLSMEVDVSGHNDFWGLNTNFCHFYFFFEIKILISWPSTIDYKDGFMMLKSVLSQYFQDVLRELRKLYEIIISDSFNPTSISH